MSSRALLRFCPSTTRYSCWMLLGLLLIPLVTHAGTLVSFAGEPSPAGPPNIVLIMGDDIGYECLGANGSESYQTPELDRLADQGIRFEHCHATPVCTPSRVKIMTGMTNRRNYVGFGTLDRDQTTFAHLLKNAGYATAIAGKWQLGDEADSAQHFGFDESCLWQQQSPTWVDGLDTRYSNPVLSINGVVTDFEESDYGPDICTDFLLDFIEQNQDQPFLVYYPMILPHWPFDPTPDSPDWQPDPGQPKSERYGDEEYFDDMIHYMDKLVGTIHGKLEELGLAENTLFIYTGDNGTYTGITSQWNGQSVRGGKKTLTDRGTRVPLIASWPAAGVAGVVNSDLIDFSDFFPTMLEAAGIAIPEALPIDGHSFLPVIQGRPFQPRETAYLWYSHRLSAENAKIIARTKFYKLFGDGDFLRVNFPDETTITANELTPEEATVKEQLQAVLDEYARIEPIK